MAQIVPVPLSFTSWERSLADFAESVIRNRIFEQNPSQVEGASLIARPSTGLVGGWGVGKIRGFFSLPGLFGGALFVVSGETLYRIETDLSSISVTGVVFGSGSVSMAGVSGAGYERLFVADGNLLQFYGGGTRATATLSQTGRPSAGDQVEINGTYYQWVSGAPGSGVGTSGDPFKVTLGADVDEDLDNLVAAINFTGIQGVTYSATLGGQNSDVSAARDVNPGDPIVFTAKTDLAIANTYSTTETSANLSFGGATMSGGGVHGLSGVAVPDGLPPVSVTILKKYVLVALGNTDRFYYIEPGEVTIDALNFATAESQPDDVLDVLTVGDTAMFVGESSTEAWYPTGDLDTPFAPVPGRVYDRGAIEGSAVNVKGTVFLVGADNVVYAIGGSAQRVSNHGVEEVIREALGG